MECRSGRIGHCGLWWWRASWERMRKKRERDVMRERRGSYTLHQRWSSVSRDQHAIVISSPLPLSISPDPFTPPTSPPSQVDPPHLHPFTWRRLSCLLSFRSRRSDHIWWPTVCRRHTTTNHDDLLTCARQRLFSNPTFSEETVQRSISVIHMAKRNTSQYSNDLKC